MGKFTHIDEQEQVLSVLSLYEDKDEIENYEDEFDRYLKRKENW